MDMHHVIPDQISDAIPIPPLAAHVWGYFVDLGQTRSSGEFGPSRLTRGEIREWEEDEGVQLQRWERRAILMLDSAWLASLAKPEPEKPEHDEEID